VVAADERVARTEAVRLAVMSYDLEHDEVTVLATTRLLPAGRSAGWLVRVRVA